VNRPFPFRANVSTPSRLSRVSAENRLAVFACPARLKKSTQ
jgi:hypothetical protein